MPTHRVAVQDALIALFQIPVPDEDSVGRTVLTRVLGPSFSFGKAIFNFRDNEHLKNLVTPGPTPVVWESKQKTKYTHCSGILESESHRECWTGSSLGFLRCVLFHLLIS